jgi:hypothetical protein
VCDLGFDIDRGDEELLAGGGGPPQLWTVVLAAPNSDKPLPIRFTTLSSSCSTGRGRK